MSAKPETIRLNPVREPGTGKVIGWKIKYNTDPEYSPGSAPPFVLAKDSGPREFTVKINGNPANVKFADDALWVSQGTASPNATGVDNQICGVKRMSNGDLKFIDMNGGDPVQLSYRLKFTGAPDIDPIIDNGGGTFEPPAPPGFWPGGGSAGSIDFLSLALLFVLVIGFVIGRTTKRA